MLRKNAILTFAAAIAVALVCSPVKADGAKGSATIKGRAVFEGNPPAIKPIQFGGDNHCVQAHQGKAEADQGTIVYKAQGNAVPYVLVYIKEGVKDKYDPPAEPVVIDQKDCMYHPHVFGMIAGQQLNIKNSDPTNHNIHSLAKKNPTFNFAQPNAGMVKELKGKDTFTREEFSPPAKIKCDVHAWMSTYVGVFSHPYFDVTKDHEQCPKGSEANRGTFEIKNLPAGEYEVAAWHETFGVMTQKVSIKDGETKEIEFKYGAKKAQAPGDSREVILSAETGGDPKK